MTTPVILIVDDLPENRQLLSKLLALNGYQVQTAENGEVALGLCSLTPPDLVLMDVLMPGMDGLTACKALKGNASTRLIPVVMLTGLSSSEDRIQALEAGADDFISKPFHRQELLSRVRNLLAVKRFTDELENASNVLQAVARIVESRDQYTGDHCQSVSDTAVKIGTALGVSSADLETLKLGGMLHDLGKIGVPDAILHKPGKLTDEEFAIIKSHTSVGDELLKPLNTLHKVRPLVRWHHEKLDGSGYPDHLKGDQISLPVRIMSVSDVFTALASARSYKPAFSPERSLDILKEEAAKGWWDTTVLSALGDALQWDRTTAAA